MNIATPTIVAAKTKLDWAMEANDGTCSVFPVWETLPEGSCACGDAACKSIGKHPAIDKWKDNATRDPEQITAWWTANPDRNIGRTPDSDHVFIDLDMKREQKAQVAKGKKGDKEYQPAKPAKPAINGKLELTKLISGTVANSAPRTKTPGGGFHLQFDTGGEAFKNSQSKIGPGIDVRGPDGYVLAPGSSKYVNGKEVFYTLINPSVKSQPLPQALIAEMEAITEKEHKSREPVGELDTENRIKNAVAFVSSPKWCRPSIEGQGGNGNAYAVAAMLQEIGISADRAMAILMDWKIVKLTDGNFVSWNDSCEGPWDFDDLLVTVQNAYLYAQETPGTADLMERLEIVEGGDVGTTLSDAEFDAMRENTDLDMIIDELFKDVNNTKALAESIEAYELTDDDFVAENHEGMEYIYSQTYSRGLAAFTAAPGGVGKSSLKLLRAILAAIGLKAVQKIIASGGDAADRLRAVIEAGEKPEDDPVKIWYWNLEDSFANTMLRVIALCEVYGIDPKDVKKNLLLNGSADQMTMAHSGEKGMTVIYTPVLKKMARVIMKKGIELLLVDPFIKTVEVNNENDNAAMKVAVGVWCLLADRLKIAVGLAHHSAKWNGKNIEEYKATALRGAGALHDLVRLVEVLVPMNTEEHAASVSPDDWRRYFYIYAKKENFGRNSRERRWFTFIGHDVAGSKMGRHPDRKRSVGVTTVARLNSVISDYTGTHITAMLEIIKEMTPPSSKSDPRYEDFEDGLIEGPATMAGPARGNVTGRFCEVLGCAADFSNTEDDTKVSQARKKASKALDALLEHNLVDRGDVFSPWRKKQGSSPHMKNAYTVSPAGHRYIEQHNLLVKANEAVAGSDENFGPAPGSD